MSDKQPRSPLPTSEMTPELPEILDALESANRLFHGWHFDGLWSEYDESVRQKVQRVLNKLRGMPEHIDMEMPHTAAAPPSLDAPAEMTALTYDDSKRIDALESLIEQSGIKGVEIGQGCYSVISIGNVEVACENTLRDALDALIDLQTESPDAV